jgi:hypothetical protein
VRDVCRFAVRQSPDAHVRSVFVIARDVRVEDCAGVI